MKYDQKRGLQSGLPLAPHRKLLRARNMTKILAYNQGIRSLLTPKMEGFTCVKYDQELGLQSRLPLTPKRKFLRRKISPKPWPTIKASVHLSRPNGSFYVVRYDQKRDLQSLLPLTPKRKFLRDKNMTKILAFNQGFCSLLTPVRKFLCRKI